ncbi:unnamed protein product [Moneuplotes crassus]|uniref:Uncharacterized protein n=1 Tax=Euplotes crassus TaxID=5936 RepID=A0AAD1Y349_EUPCR|nr:unnamed protein product [Moneuplotes crassus]
MISVQPAYKKRQYDFLWMFLGLVKLGNIVLIVLDLALLVFNAQTFQALLAIFIAHSIVLFPSALFHLVPSLKRNSCYRILAFAIGIFGIIAVVINYILIITSEGSKALVYLFFMIILTLPGALISGSLIILLYLEAPQTPEVVILVPTEHIGLHNVMI